MTQPLLPFVVANPPTPALFTQMGADKGTAFTGTGIETNNPEIKVVITIETIFGRAALTFLRTKPKITFTSLFRALPRGIKRKRGVG
jgi:hypothetical protein